MNRKVLTALGVVDIARGVMHTFFMRFAASRIADIPDVNDDELVLMNALGVSNFKTALAKLLVAHYGTDKVVNVLLVGNALAIFLGFCNSQIQALDPTGEFPGKYLMAVYAVFCIAVVSIG